MSTKIYNAYLFKGTNAEMMKFLVGYRRKVKKAYADYLVKAADVAYVDNTPIKYLGMFKLMELIKDASKVGSVSLFNFSSSIVVFIHGKKKILQFFVFDSVATIGFRNELEQDPRFSDYHYQNQCDPWYEYEKLQGDELRRAKSDYNRRRKVWKEIYSDGLYTPSSAGLVYDMMTESDVTDVVIEALELMEKLYKPTEITS